MKNLQRVCAGFFLVALLFVAGADVVHGQGPGGGNGGGPPSVVNSFNGRTGAVVSISGDYSFPLITGSAAKTQLPGVTAFTDQANSFTGNQSIAGNLSISGGTLTLPNTTSSTVGVIKFGSTPFIHNYGTNTGNCVVGNTFVGQSSGNFFSQTSCVNGNTGVGYASLNSLSSGNGNTGVGYLALGQNSSAFLNTAMGIQALFNNQTGVSNTAIGAFALELNVNGHNNIAVGDRAGTAAGSGSNQNNIFIGNSVGEAESSTIRIGSVDQNTRAFLQTRTFVAGISGVTTGGVAVPVVIDANGQLGTAGSSSRQVKYDIHDMNDASRNLMRLRPVTFRYKQAQNDGSHPLQYGLIAEEVAQVYPELVQFDPKTNQPKAVLYHLLPGMLLNEVQKQHQEIEAQQKQIRSLQDQLQQLAAETRQLQTELVSLKGRERAGKVALVSSGK
jgi:hypothetical protein